MKTKICAYCHKRKLLTEYYRAKGYADGHCTRCKPCFAEVRHRHYLKNRERALEQQHAYYAARREEILAAHKEYNQTHREYTREYVREYYWRNKRRMLEYSRRYREAKKSQIARSEN